MVARQLLSTFMADSATAAGVRTSSHAREERRTLKHWSQQTKRNKKCKEMHLFSKKKYCLRSVLLAMVPLKEREIDFLDSSSAGVCSRGTELTCWPAGEGTWAAARERDLTRRKREHKTEKMTWQMKGTPDLKELHETFCECVLLMFAHTLRECES